MPAAGPRTRHDGDRRRVVEARLLGKPEQAAMLAFLDWLGYDPATVVGMRVTPNPVLGGLDCEVEHLVTPGDHAEAGRRARRALQV